MQLRIRTKVNSVVRVQSVAGGFRLADSEADSQRLLRGLWRANTRAGTCGWPADWRWASKESFQMIYRRGNKDNLKWNLTARPTEKVHKERTPTEAGLLLAGLEMAEHFNHGVNSFCSTSECRQASKKEDQPLAINSRSTDKINPAASKSQESRHPTKQSSRNWLLEWRSDIQESSKHTSTEIYKKGEDGWTNTGAPH